MVVVLVLMEVQEVFCGLTLLGMVGLVMVMVGLIDLVVVVEKVVTEKDEADHWSGYFVERIILKDFQSELSRFLHCSV